MGSIAANSLADRFAWLFDGLCKAIGVDAHKQRMEAAFAWAIWNRVRLLGDRLIALAERVRAGRIPVRRTPGPSPQGGTKHAPAGARRTPNSLPRDFGWMARLAPEAAKYVGALHYMLRDPETAALVAKAPQSGRMLRPLCHLLGVQPPGFLRRGATIAPEVETPIAAQPPPAPGPLTPPPPSDGVAADPPATEQKAEPPPPRVLTPQEAALGHARRPGGLYWDGKRLQWS